MEPAVIGGGRARGRSRGRSRANVSGESVTPNPGSLARSLGQLSLDCSASIRFDVARIETDDNDRGAGPKPLREPSLLAARPGLVTDKTGTAGRPIKLSANYFGLLSLPQYCVHQYHIDFVPSVESSRIRRAMVGEHRQHFGRCYVFDGMSDLKTPSRLEQNLTELRSQRQSDGTEVCVRIRWIQELAPNNPDLLRLFNTQMRRNLQYLDFVQINRHYFDKRAVSAISQHGLELWQGIVTAIRQHETGVMMVTDVVHKALRRETVLDFLRHISSTVLTGYREEAIRRVTGAIVMTPYNNKTYRVDDVDWAQSPRCTFESKEGPKTYVEYYQAHYEKSIRDHSQPLLVCRPSEKDLRAGRTNHIYLVPELCLLTGLTDEMLANVGVMRGLAQHSRIEPPRRVLNLLDLIARVNGDPKVAHEMSRWGVQFDDQLVSIDARVMPPERVIQGTHIVRCGASPTDFSREMRDNQMHAAVKLDSWIVICPKRDERNCAEFVRTLMSVGLPMGVRVREPHQLELEDDRAGSYGRLLQQLSGVQLALVILPNNRKDRYDMIKKQACVHLGLQTQVLLSRTIANRRNIRSVAANVAIQLNCKLGGQAWCLEIPLARTMVIGYDTYYDSSQRGRSAGALVASLNKTFTRWFSRVSFHSTHQELGDALALQFKDALNRYASENGGAAPERILFYRDGVSDDEIPQVRRLEIESILASLDETFPGREHKLAFLVVTKRISMRFFDITNSGGHTNSPPGTVVDSEVTRPEQYEFFLVSQTVRQGTVMPTHYNVIYDTTGLKPDHMQRVSYKLTHLYFNWPGTIRVPAPCQYAHKLAFLAGQSLHTEHHARLADTLFYL